MAVINHLLQNTDVWHRVEASDVNNPTWEKSLGPDKGIKYQDTLLFSVREITNPKWEPKEEKTQSTLSRQTWKRKWLSVQA